MSYIVEITSDGMIYISSFMKIDSEIQKLLTYYFDDLRGCSVDTTSEG
jgi:hypothetical protein